MLINDNTFSNLILHPERSRIGVLIVIPQLECGYKPSCRCIMPIVECERNMAKLAPARLSIGLNKNAHHKPFVTPVCIIRRTSVVQNIMTENIIISPKDRRMNILGGLVNVTKFILFVFRVNLQKPRHAIMRINMQGARVLT